MNETTETEREFHKVDMTKPVFLVFDQTDQRNSIEVFQGSGAEEAAITRAREKAGRTGRLIAVLGPQNAVYGPPPKVDAVEVTLPWHDGRDAAAPQANLE
ncbi:MAG: hypothetical protein KDJ43_10345 [Rhizobiaceae bacterium]|nr:hypothetical protein [Rhizobiaceae bacterium]